MSTTAKSRAGSPRHAPPERASRARQRQRLIDACISALYEHGPSRTTIDKVVSIAEMSPGIVSFYFETKAALLVACLEHLAQEFDAQVMQPVQALRDDPAAALERLVDLYLDPEIASPRKVSVWYAFWGEATARAEYLTICGKRDLAFADLVRSLVAARSAARGDTDLDADAIALGLIGCLEMLWQEIAFREERQIDRTTQRKRCRAYLASVFPQRRGAARHELPAPSAGHAQLVAAHLQLAGTAAACVYPPGGEAYVLARPATGAPQSVAIRTQISRDSQEDIVLCASAGDDWTAFVLRAPGEADARVILLVPRQAVKALRRTSLSAGDAARLFAAWQGNFTLAEKPAAGT